MATIRRKKRTAASKPSMPQWEGLSGVLPWPMGISAKDRTSIFRKGKIDARHGLVSVNEYDELISPFFEELVHQANQRITLVWKECEEKSATLCVTIEQLRRNVAYIDEKLGELDLEQQETVERIENTHYDGDDAVSAHMAERRRRNRVQSVQAHFDQRRATLNDERFHEAQKAISYQYDLAQARETALSNEQLIRTDYLWRLSIYAYGASSFVRITPDMINDSALSDEPQERYEKAYSAMTQNLLRFHNES